MRLHAQWSRATVKAIQLDYCPCPSIRALRENWFIVWLRYGRQRYAPFSWSLSDLLPFSQTIYKQVSKRLTQSLWNDENMDNFTALNTSYLRFTFGTKSMHASPCACGNFVFIVAFFYKFVLLEFWVKNQCGYYWQNSTERLGQSRSSWTVSMKE